ncbi:hypothetical protein DES53_106329 [Roseimicrobium gellanilyticum]|uniref:Uncharacterized protein n=1 Tax=Roseimicrobium gellanilyticum TaxID=748857 RepID=A0A366HKH3_9BACT|nr:hypothetical protein [Roseimicrobium gellanilyticum]RBP42620.1 hypothetical protein DES53_106329 [Roseimicrobium gellanilyticum]
MKWRRKLLLAIALLFASLGMLMLLVHVRGLRMWEDYCAQVRAAGDPVRLEDVIPASVPDAENVAMAEIFRELFQDESSARLAKNSLASVYRRSSDDELISTPTGWLVRGEDRYVREWLEFLKGLEKESSRSKPTTLEPPLSLSPNKELQLRLRQYDSLWDELSVAVRRPYCRWPLEYQEGARMKSPHNSSVIKLAPLLKARLTAHAACDDTSQYVRDLTTAFSLSRHLSNTQMSMLSTLVANTFWNTTLNTMQRTAGAVTLSDAELAMIQEHASVQALQGLLQALKKDQVLSTDTLLNINVNELASLLDGDFGSMLSGQSERLQKLQATLILSRPSGWRLGELAARHRESRTLWKQSVSHDFQYIQTGSLEAIRNRSLQLEENSRWLSYDSMFALAEIVTPRMFERAAQVQASSNAAVLWCAVERYRLRYERLPDSLETLAPEFVKKVPVDPMHGGPMRYLKTKSGGYLIYSIGPNGIDDGGQGSGSTRDLDWVWASGPGLAQND